MLVEEYNKAKSKQGKPKGKKNENGTETTQGGDEDRKVDLSQR